MAEAWWYLISEAICDSALRTCRQKRDHNKMHFHEFGVFLATESSWMQVCFVFLFMKKKYPSGNSLTHLKMTPHFSQQSHSQNLHRKAAPSCTSPVAYQAKNKKVPQGICVHPEEAWRRQPTSSPHPCNIQQQRTDTRASITGSNPSQVDHNSSWPWTE